MAQAQRCRDVQPLHTILNFKIGFQKKPPGTETRTINQQSEVAFGSNVFGDKRQIRSVAKIRRKQVDDRSMFGEQFGRQCF